MKRLIIIMAFAILLTGCGADFETIVRENPPSRPTDAQMNCVPNTKQKLMKSEVNKTMFAWTCVDSGGQRHLYAYQIGKEQTFIVNDFETAHSLNLAYAKKIQNLYNKEVEGRDGAGIVDDDPDRDGRINREDPYITMYYQDDGEVTVTISNYVTVESSETFEVNKEFGLIK